MKNNNLHSKMALERGNSQGKGVRTALAGVGFGLVSLAAWNVLDSKPDNGQVVSPQEDAKNTEFHKPVALRSERVKADVSQVLQQLGKIPSDLPHLNGVKEETLQEKSKKFLAEVDKWLHVPADSFDLTPEADMSDEQRELFMNYKQDFEIAVADTRRIMKDDLLFWEAKQKIDAAFPNYALMGAARNEYTDPNYVAVVPPTGTVGYLMERPKLTDYDGKTMTGFKPPSSHLIEWKIYNKDGLIYYQSPDYNGGRLISGSVEDFIATIEAYAKHKALMDKYNDPEVVKQYEQQGFK